MALGATGEAELELSLHRENEGGSIWGAAGVDGRPVNWCSSNDPGLANYPVDPPSSPLPEAAPLSATPQRWAPSNPLHWSLKGEPRPKEVWPLLPAPVGFLPPPAPVGFLPSPPWPH